MRKSICIISLSPVYRDGRVLRQIKYLAPHYDLTVIGFGPPHSSWSSLPLVRWIPVTESRVPFPVALALLVLGKIWSPAYEMWYWRKPQHREAFEHARSSHCDAYYANEWDALPLAVEAARRKNAPVVYDAHEYTTSQYENLDPLRRWLMPSAMRYLFQKYTPFVAASITVEPTIAKKLEQAFSLDPIVVLNAPGHVVPPFHNIDPQRIRLIHHGSAQRNRRPEAMIEAIALCDQRYSLHLMFTQDGSDYVRELKRLAERVAPGRVDFHEPVLPEEIVPCIAQYDIGFYILAPSNENNRMMLPNKFFEFVMAGLAVCIGPSLPMSKFIRQYRFGCVASTLDPVDVAAMLNRLDVDQLESMRQAAREAARQLNAERELAKVVELFHRLFQDKARTAS